MTTITFNKNLYNQVYFLIVRQTSLMIVLESICCEFEDVSTSLV